MLGDQSSKQVSFVEPDRLRFDFTHFSATSPDEHTEVENLVNGAILEGMRLILKKCRSLRRKKIGATALFGEKYGDIVRVVSMGSFSTELCGGTHLDTRQRTAMFAISSEFSVASGVRRIEATVGQATLETMKQNGKLIFELSGALKANHPSELVFKAGAAGFMNSASCAEPLMFSARKRPTSRLPLPFRRARRRRA